VRCVTLRLDVPWRAAILTRHEGQPSRFAAQTDGNLGE